MLKKRHSFAKRAIGFSVSAVFFLAAAWILLSREQIIDQLNVWQYKPTSEIATIASRADMSEQGRFYFYASNPVVETANDFNANCQRQEPNNAILGCYANGRIYIYSVDNVQLDGIEEVTAAHETLHAVWTRMSEPDKKSVGAMLDIAFSQIDDSYLKDRMDYYARNEPGERSSELHSILGTEYPNLGSDLEAHYRKYFIDRTKVVSYQASYQAVFNNLKAQSSFLFNELKTLKDELDAKVAQYNSDAVYLQDVYNSLVGRSSLVNRTNPTEVNQYNAELTALKKSVAELEKTKADILVLQTTYGTKVEVYNNLILASNNLVRSIDSTLAPDPSVQ
jgi:hypothetical protein